MYMVICDYSFIYMWNFIVIFVFIMQCQCHLLLGVECVLYIKGGTAVLHVRKSQNPSQQEEKKKLNEEREKLT